MKDLAAPFGVNLSRDTSTRHALLHLYLVGKEGLAVEISC